MPEIKILNSASEQEIAVITAVINILSGREAEPEKEVFSRWQNYSRRSQEDRELWESSGDSLWKLESRKF
jgi:hypothetical protein